MALMDNFVVVSSSTSATKQSSYVLVAGMKRKQTKPVGRPAKRPRKKQLRTYVL